MHAPLRDVRAGSGSQGEPGFHVVQRFTRILGGPMPVSGVSRFVILWARL